MPRAGLVQAVQKKTTNPNKHQRPNFFIQNNKQEEEKQLDSKLNTQINNSLASTDPKPKKVLSL
jgi:hypothetical protein